jgi:hypothetical protein
MCSQSKSIDLADIALRLRQNSNRSERSTGLGKIQFPRLASLAFLTGRPVSELARLRIHRSEVLHGLHYFASSGAG